MVQSRGNIKERVPSTDSYKQPSAIYIYMTKCHTKHRVHSGTPGLQHHQLSSPWTIVYLTHIHPDGTNIIHPHLVLPLRDYSVTIQFVWLLYCSTYIQVFWCITLYCMMSTQKKIGCGDVSFNALHHMNCSIFLKQSPSN